MCPTSSQRQSDTAKRRTDSIRPNEPSQAKNNSSTQSAKQKPFMQISIIIVIVVAVAGLLSLGWWMSQGGLFLASSQGSLHDGQDSHSAGNHADAADAHAGQNHTSDNANSLELSEQAQKNIGLELVTIKLRDFDRTINMPAMVTQRPGQTEIKVSAPMTGIVERIYPIRGEAVTPGQPLFDLRLTHKDLVDTQIAFLKVIEQLDVINREVERLEKVTSSGAIAGKRLLERQYEQHQIEANLRAQQQALLLHGLSQKQIEDIRKTRKLLQRLTIRSPQPLDALEGLENTSTEGKKESLLQISKIEVGRGEHVETGDLLCILSDHETLYIEGNAFEEDAAKLNEVANTGAPVSAVIETSGSRPQTVSDLKILYLENEVEQDSRALRFYILLPNELVRNEKTKDGHRFIGWRFKPGQRVQLLVPVERWKDCIVLPADAVVKEGADYYIFQKNGDSFQRKPVHVEHHDQRWAVIANDGSLFPGDIVVASGAYQMHLTLKNKAGGGVDPHAGHHH
ncbi:MAG: efflux RND transporter periplasmic adaptor subunit [Pirellulales bacterium]|nr:efflux RND transporter periplasmic adaptor subunit [Pirellulales bacterium]